MNDDESAPVRLSSALMRGSAWMIGMRWVLRMVGLVSTAILARLLAPADFGIVAMAAIVAGLLETAAYAGVDLALIRAEHESRDFYDSAWTIQILQACAIAALLVAAAPLTASFYHEPRVSVVILFLAVKAIIEGFQNIGVVAFRRELDFAREFRFNVYSKLLNLVIVVAAALYFRSYIALVTGLVSGAVVSVVLSYVMHPYRPRFTLKQAGQLWGFSNWLLVSRVGSFLSRKVDQLIIGGAIGSAALGSYHVATELATMPTTEFVMPMRRALFPALSLLQSDPAGFRAAVLNTFSALAVLCFAAGFGLMSVAEEAVPLILGEKWRAAVPLVRLLAVYGAFAGLASVLEVPIWAAGKTHVSAIQSWLELVVLLPALVFIVPLEGANGAAAARALVALALLPVMFVLVSRVSPVLRVRDFLGALWRPLLAALAMTLALAAPIAYPGPLVAVLLTKIGVGGAVYAGVLLLLWLASGRPEGLESAVLRRLRPAA